METFGGFPFAPAPHPLRSTFIPIFDAADHIVVYSDIAKRSFIENGVAEQKISVVPLGFTGAVDYVGPSHRDPHLLVYVGRVDAYKGVDVAVETVRRLGSPFRLAVAGPASPEAAAWLRKKPHVEYLGILTKQQLRSLWRGAGYMLAPSVESFGFAVLEALSLGTPTITRETTGVSSLLPRSIANVVSGRSPDAWASKIVELSRSYGDLVSEHSVRSSLPSISWDAARDAQLEVYRSQGLITR
jgi:glycosyltransferase involved in cell wall biosynthesis